MMDQFIPFRFRVELFSSDNEGSEGQREILCSGAFSEVTGLEASIKPLSIREGGRNWGEIQLAGPTSFAAVVLKRGVTSNEHLWRWFDLTHRREFYNLRLLGEINVLAPHDPTQVLLRWRLEGVMPTKFRGPDLNATSNQVAIEELQLVHEGLTLQRPAATEAANG